MRRMISETEQKFLKQAKENIAFEGTDTEIGGDVEIDGDLQVNSDASIGQDLTVTGDITANNVTASNVIDSVMVWATEIDVYDAVTESDVLEIKAEGTDTSINADGSIVFDAQTGIEFASDVTFSGLNGIKIGNTTLTETDLIALLALIQNA